MGMTPSGPDTHFACAALRVWRSLAPHAPREECRMLDVSFISRLIRVTLAGGPFPDIENAISLLLGTCAQESGFQYNRQLGGGPARGYWQCEPATEEDVWLNYLAYNPELADFFAVRCGMTGPNTSALEHNLVYQIILARTHYYRCDPDPLPAADDIEEGAVRWKQYYNTPAGAGTPEEYVENYHRLVAPSYPAPPVA